MPGGGHLRFAAAPGHQAARPAELDADGAYVALTVSDDGAGMDEATLARACEPFFTTKGLNGTGLGLASVQGFVRQSGGELRITSTPGQGTRIEIWLPVAVAAVRAEMRPAVPRTAATARILLVDDEPGVREAVAECLETAGFRLEVTADAEAALRVLQSRGPFDALVTDFMLPGMDGADLVAEARHMYPGIATLVNTGGAATDGLRDLPADTTVMHKPFRREDLIERVKHALDADTAAAGAGGAQFAAD
jgi:CheY-like chemotaxis protein